MLLLLRIADAFRLLVFRLPRFVALEESILGLAVCAVLYSLSPALLDAQFVGAVSGSMRINWTAILLPLASLAAISWFAWVIQRTSAQVSNSELGVTELSTNDELLNNRPALSASAIVATALMASVVLDLLLLIVQLVSVRNAALETAHSMASLGLFAWWVVCVLVGGYRMLHAAGVWTSTRLLGALAAFAPVAALATLAVKVPGEGFFIPKAAQTQAEKTQLASDEIWSIQQEVIKDRMARLLPDTKGKVDAYFLSFAPDSEEDVFLRETTVIQNLMDERFKTQGRSLRLINHSSLYRTEPAATQAHLERALNHIGKLMNPKEDLLVLYLTGHGSKSAELMARADQMKLTNLTANRLDKLLRAANIQNAVIAVSACYSGSWMDALANDNRAVLTASSAQKTSFGCGSESEFTYWGKAVFDEGLRMTHSVEKAFNDAIPRLRRRENEAGHEFSDPQMAIGSSIRRLLERWEQQLTR